jgi:hypothetical protein
VNVDKSLTTPSEPIVLVGAIILNVGFDRTVEEVDRELIEWFASIAEPENTDIAPEVEVSHHEPLPYRRIHPRLRRWHGASTMTRGRLI